MAELPMPHQWPTALQAMRRCLHHQGFVSCVNKSNEVDTRNACLCVRRIEVQMSKTSIKFLWVKIRRKKTFDKTVKKLPSQRCQRWFLHWLQCRKVECRRGKSRENTECFPGFFALISASTTRGATQCQRNIMTRGSQPVCSAARCPVTNTHNRFQVTSHNQEGPNSSSYNDVWACKYPLQRLVYTRNHTSEASFMEPARWHSLRMIFKNL